MNAKISDAHAEVFGIAFRNPCVNAYETPNQDWAAGILKSHCLSGEGSSIKQGYAVAINANAATLENTPKMLPTICDQNMALGAAPF